MLGLHSRKEVNAKVLSEKIPSKKLATQLKDENFIYEQVSVPQNVNQIQSTKKWDL